MMRVKIVSGRGADAPKPVTKAEIKGQGSIPYCQLVEVATPNTEKAKVTSGTKRGTGAALRGKKFTNA